MSYRTNSLRVMSLNVNGLNNPMKRRKVRTKFRKEMAQVILVQETNLSSIEHEKLKKWGYRNTFYRSYRKGNRRGVAIMISNATKCEKHTEVCDKEGRYMW